MLTQDQEKAKQELLGFLISATSKFFVLSGYAGVGKEQPVSTFVQTPQGAKRFGDLNVGDLVFGQNGKPTRVMAIYPQGTKPVYKVSLRDGTHTRCGLDHLWSVFTAKKGSKLKTYSTRELLALGLTNSHGGFKYKLPLCSPVEYPDIPLTFDPYILGVVIGDGYLGGAASPSVSCTDTDIEIINEIKNCLPESFDLRTHHTTPCKQYRIVDTQQHNSNRFKDFIKAIGLAVSSKHKFIPLPYLQASVTNRIRLLKGLMDTDGCSKGNRITYSTKSLQLALDVQTLVQSLGGTAIVHTYNRENTLKGVEYRVNVKVNFNPFMLSRKAENWKKSDKNPPSRYITAIEFIGYEDQMCITVDAPDCLYLTDSFIVTHNTYLIQHVQEAYNTCIAKMNQVTGGTKPKQWVYTATTNKAVHSLKQAVHGTEVRTIHSLLGLRLRNDYKTGQSFVSQAYGVDNVENSIVVIDEASYVDYQLLHYINETISDTSKVIFMGDPTQLTPVGLNHCPVFKNICEDQYALTEVVRQSKQHPLTPLLDNFRQYILGLTQQFPKVTTCNFIQVVNTPTFEQMLLQEFNSEWHSSMSKVLAWRNKTVIKYNDFIFNALNNRSSFMIGDIVTNNHAVGQHLKTDTEVEIIGGCSTQSLGYKGTNYLVELPSGITTGVFVPDKQSDYTRAKNKAVKEGQTKDVQIIMDTWADLRPTFASTVNKAQGSTYDKVFIDLSDFKPMVHKDPIQLARLLYVAMSRARTNVIFTGDLC